MDIKSLNLYKNVLFTKNHIPSEKYEIRIQDIYFAVKYNITFIKNIFTSIYFTMMYFTIFTKV
jgi:hypothetical protein